MKNETNPEQLKDLFGLSVEVIPEEGEVIPINQSQRTQIRKPKYNINVEPAQDVNKNYGAIELGC